MSTTLRWSYALNQWNNPPTAFVRHEHQERVLRSCSVLGFDAVELQGGSGRWNNMGRREHIELGHGSIGGFREFLARSGITQVSSMTWDPTAPAEEEGGARRSTSSATDRATILDSATRFLDLLADLEARTFVVRAAESAWLLADGPDLGAIGDLHNAIGAESSARGIRLALDVDCLSALRPHLPGLLAATDPALVGINVDTAELTIAGHDPLAVIRENPTRIAHVQLKDARVVDSGDAYRQPFAETALLQGGAEPHVERWFYELGTAGGLVDVAGVVDALAEIDYTGWVVVESDQSPAPTESAMLNAWYLRTIPRAGFPGSRSNR